MLVTTRGDKGTSDPDADLDALGRLRVEETAAAARVLGVAATHHLDHPDGEIVDDRALRLQLVRAVRTVRPDVVLCPDPTSVFFGDAYVNHRDHRVTGWATIDAVTPAAGNPHYFPELRAEGLDVHQPSALYLSGTFDPNVWIDVTGTLDRKIEALFCHASQLSDTGEWFREFLARRPRRPARPRASRTPRGSAGSRSRSPRTGRVRAPLRLRAQHQARDHTGTDCRDRRADDRAAGQGRVARTRRDLDAGNAADELVGDRRILRAARVHDAPSDGGAEQSREQDARERKGERPTRTAGSDAQAGWARPRGRIVPSAVRARLTGDARVDRGRRPRRRRMPASCSCATSAAVASRTGARPVA